MDIVGKLWSFCHTLRHDGVDSGDYIEQLTYLLFLKMADEKNIDVPDDCRWEILKEKSGPSLMDYYADLLQKLKSEEGILGDIFSQPIPRINNPTNLKRLINLIDAEEWTKLDIDVKGAAFEGLLERAASDGKKGAGQYFTPRPLIRSIVQVLQPNPLESDSFNISDPACGTGGFLVVAFEWFLEKNKKDKLTKKQLEKVKTRTYFGQELVNRPRRLALMNLFLHNVNPQIQLGDTIYSKKSIVIDKFDCVITNPPFGSKGGNDIPDRDDFHVKTSNKQLNFIQYVMSALKKNGRAAMVLPDNCLFDDKASEVLRYLTRDFDLHTILKLPDGTFNPYAQGVKANVIFFNKGKKTQNVWIYDARSNVPSVTKGRPLTQFHFSEFIKLYGNDPYGKSKRKETDRFKKFNIKEIEKGGYKLNYSWIKENTEEQDSLKSSNLLSDAIKDLEDVLRDFREISQIVKIK